MIPPTAAIPASTSRSLRATYREERAVENALRPTAPGHDSSRPTVAALAALKDPDAPNFRTFDQEQVCRTRLTVEWEGRTSKRWCPLAGVVASMFGAGAVGFLGAASLLASKRASAGGPVSDQDADAITLGAAIAGTLSGFSIYFLAVTASGMKRYDLGPRLTDEVLTAALGGEGPALQHTRTFLLAHDLLRRVPGTSDSYTPVQGDDRLAAALRAVSWPAPGARLARTHLDARQQTALHAVMTRTLSLQQAYGRVGAA